jgi:UDP:flavonoid glycosyltransferase YjiC (YdhE family)
MALRVQHSDREVHMKILLASTPATGHLNPLLAIGRILIAEGHQVVCLSGNAFRDRIESIGAAFRSICAMSARLYPN